MTFFFLLFYRWLLWVLVASRGLAVGMSRGALHRGAQASHCSGFSYSGTWAPGCVGFSSCSSGAQQLWHMGFSCSHTCGIFPDQRLNLCPLYWQVDSHPLYHQGSPGNISRSCTLREIRSCRDALHISACFHYSHGKLWHFSSRDSNKSLNYCL